MRTGTDGGMIVQLFDEFPHLDEKNLIVVYNTQNTPSYFDISRNTGMESGLNKIRYYFNVGNPVESVTIEWSDILRIYPDGEVVIEGNGGQSLTFHYSAKQGKRPPLSISPCRNMIFGDGQKIEIIHNYSVFVFALVSGAWVKILYDLNGYDGSLEIPEGATMVKYRLNNLTAHNLFMEFLAVEPTPKQISDFLAAIKYDIILLKPRSCNTRYELLKWTSAYGNEKRAWFEVEDFVVENTKTQEFATLDINYKVLKNREESFTAAIYGVMPSDIEYFSDIITSDEVYLMVYNEATALYEPERVFVSTKKITIPNGVQKSDFKIEIKHRHYDLF